MANGYDQHSLAHADTLRTRKRAVSALSPLDEPRETVNAASSALTETCVRESARTAGMPASEAITFLREATKSGGGNPFAKGGAFNKDDEDDEDDKKKKKGASGSSSDSGSSKSGSSGSKSGSSKSSSKS